MEKKRIMRCVMDEEGKLGVYAIGLVSEPAIEEKWIALSDIKLSSVDAERKMLYGAALVPDKKILRYDQENNEEYFILFEKETIYRCAHLFLMKHLQNAHSLEHQTPLEGCVVVESWIIEDPEHDKAKHFGMKLPAGTWMLGVHVQDDAVWNQVKEGSITGFSIEGRFDHLEVSLQREKNKYDVLIEEIEKLVSSYRSHKE
jgi:hypothetical protein